MFHKYSNTKHRYIQKLRTNYNYNRTQLTKDAVIVAVADLQSVASHHQSFFIYSIM